MVLKSSFTFLLVATMAVFSSYTPQAEAHSWADCIDWRFKNQNPRSKKLDFSSSRGYCMGYPRRFPKDKEFGSLDVAWPSRHYQQTHSNPAPNRAIACSDRKHGVEVGSDETRARRPQDAYGGRYGRMTVTSVGKRLCVRWPSKNHAKKNEPNNMVQINLAPRAGLELNQQELLKNTVALLPYKNCNPGRNEDRRTCGGCFDVPKRRPGIYQLQWRWMLNKNEWYTSCADIQIQ
ncbi:hypothetical protein BX616_007725 [Lobosporangium transversale]|uniref:Chitin-binding type-4 domain-containing protein n=1 Tax=Lobosporangium transversale TaxID=64571 RepID=A0A1Y2GQV4_9FUNG|nr:hypothetical protein BCR41DRAFT_386289 [Lobosporangium transversale]KAF9918569.1 hypothetical protein BX616_007725 [Lobosporangium transversale]ORZ16706.1 hypothetical protein BCR41DRAFT_386289 [Lobosporangium transversale]|eukprot:XP_021881641.1 hypothetical protein BCR41DRAFT_386289 [Lobosporangium transversale]